MSPLAEGRELKFLDFVIHICKNQSPLAEGRELKFPQGVIFRFCRFVAPRGGA